jgi:protein-S-isoprenylcysteine O-methyltransferase Ste14
LFIVVFVVGYALRPDAPAEWPFLRGALARWVGASVATAGVALFLWALWTFRESKTGIMAQSPVTHIVTTGPYRWSRNPMFVAFAAIYVGLALVMLSAWPLVWLPVALGATQIWVIGREERYLRATFPFEYGAYCRTVRRWL